MSTGNGNGTWKAYLLAVLMTFAGWSANELWRRNGENSIQIQGDVRAVVRDISDLKVRATALETSDAYTRARLNSIENKLDEVLRELRSK